MALIKAVTDATGASYGYWTITNIWVDPANTRAVVTLSGYVTQAAIGAGLRPSGQTFGFDITFDTNALPVPVSCASGLDIYNAAMATFYQVILGRVSADPTHPLNGAVLG